MFYLGKEFKYIYINIKFYKLLTKDENHNGFQYKEGLNVCEEGLYFTDLENLPLWIDYKKFKYIREVELLDDSLVYIEENKFKTNKFILKEKITLKDFEKWKDEEFCYKSIYKNIYSYKYTLNNDKFFEESLKKNGLSLKFIDENLQTYDLCILAINKDSGALRYVKKDLQDFNLCYLSIIKEGINIEYVRDDLKTYELCKIAIENDPKALKFIKQTYDLCYLAVSKSRVVFKYVNKELQDYELCQLAVSKNCFNFKYIRDDLKSFELSKNSYDYKKTIKKLKYNYYYC